MTEYLIFTTCHVVMTVGIFLVARSLLRRIGRDSEPRRLHGRYVLIWSVGAFAIGPFVWFEFLGGGPSDSVPYSVFQSYVMGMFFMLAGWLIGTIHGGIMLAWFRISMRRLKV